MTLKVALVLLLVLTACAPTRRPHVRRQHLPRRPPLVQHGEAVTPHLFPRDLRKLTPMRAKTRVEPYQLEHAPVDVPDKHTPPILTSRTIIAVKPLAPVIHQALPVSDGVQGFPGLGAGDACVGGACGYGNPPDPNGDIGRNHYVQAVNTSVGIFSRTGQRLAAFTFNNLWSAAGTQTFCDAHNITDPVVLYDPFGDRFILMDLAFTSDTMGPFYLCLAVSKTADPVAGGWWLYAVRADTGGTVNDLPDYPKMAISPAAVVVTANMVDAHTIPGSSFFVDARVWAFERAALESGAPFQPVVVDTATTTYFSLLPANVRGATPPANTPIYLIAQDTADYMYHLWTFRPDFQGDTTTFTGPFDVTQQPFTAPIHAHQLGTTTGLDPVGTRLKMQAQYRLIGGNESIWVTHSVRQPGIVANGIQWAQLDVTGGNILPSPSQEGIYIPDDSDRFNPSLAVDRLGNMAVAYNVSSATMFPSISFTGRIVNDAAGALRVEQPLISGGGAQTTASRWGDYSSMSIDPLDDCTFWYTNEYYTDAAHGAVNHWQTQVSRFKFATCLPATCPVTP